MDNKVYLVNDLGITNYDKLTNNGSSEQELLEALQSNSDEVDGVILVNRVDSRLEGTFGTFYAVGKNGFTGATLEPAGKPTTVPNQNKPIPNGFYDVAPLSRPFKGAFAFTIQNDEVPAYRRIYGHVGNITDNTIGCILFGSYRSNYSILYSKDTMTKFSTFFIGKNEVHLIIRQTTKQ